MKKILKWIFFIACIGLIPVRHFDWTDFPFDIVGYVAGCLVGWGINRLLKGRLRCTSKENIAG